MFDNHVHSSFSGDSKMEAVSACEKAISLGLDGIAFTDHLDYDFPDFDQNFIIDFDVHSAYMDNLKAKYEGRFKVLKSIEVGIQSHVIEESDKTVSSYDFDFVIGSVHLINRKDPYKPGFYDNYSKHEIYSLYLENILALINSFDNFDVIGHFHYIIRNALYADRSLLYKDYSEIFDQIFKALIAKGKGFEVNTASFREKPDNRTVPKYDIEILKRYRELGGEILTIGSDAHRLEHIGYKFDIFKEIIKEAGFKYITHFEKRKPVFEALK